MMWTQMNVNKLSIKHYLVNMLVSRKQMVSKWPVILDLKGAAVSPAHEIQMQLNREFKCEL